jgi:hypothetical protein
LINVNKGIEEIIFNDLVKENVLRWFEWIF